MIDIKTKIHDKFSIEFKVGFVTRRKAKKNDFSVAMWIFVPDSLDITPATYSKQDFYRDVKTNIRLITPSFILRDIVGGQALPYNNVKNAAITMASDPSRSHNTDFIYQAKMFAAIVKSSLRDECNYIIAADNEDQAKLVSNYVQNLRGIVNAFKDLKMLISTPSVPSYAIEAYNMACDFLCTVSNQHSLKLLKSLKTKKSMDAQKQEIVDLVSEINDLRHARGYSSTADVYKHGVLKKYVESQLYLRVPKKRDGFLVEQAYYSLAAGLAMIFATVIAWAFQSYFGQFTWPLFLALIISYMMKDRIKDLMRYWFAHRISNNYYDNKAKISLNNKQIGKLKEAMDFIQRSKVPQEVLKIRKTGALIPSENVRLGEKVILYRKKVYIDRDKMMENASYNYSGVNDIIRLHMNSFMHKMDNPQVSIDYLDENGKLKTALCPKDYYINIVLEYRYDSIVDYKHLIITLNREGISSIEERNI